MHILCAAFTLLHAGQEAGGQGRGCTAHGGAHTAKRRGERGNRELVSGAASGSGSDDDGPAAPKRAPKRAAEQPVPVGHQKPAPGSRENAPALAPAHQWGDGARLGATTAPEQARMQLIAVPFVPTYAEYIYLKGRRILTDQMDFLRAHFPRKSPLHARINGEFARKNNSA